MSCPAHGVRQVLLPWAAPDARFTTLFERFAIDVLTETDITGVCKILEISWDEGWHLIQRAVARGMARKERRLPTLIGVDEQAAAKGQRYLTLVCDLERATVEYIADERKQASLDGYFEALSEDERAQIKAVAMDMWEPYVNSVCAHLPDAEEKIVFDRFHIMKHMVEAVDTVRMREHRALQAEGSGSPHRLKVPVAVLARESPRTPQAALRRAESHQSQDRTGVGDQGEPTRPVALPPPRLGPSLL